MSEQEKKILEKVQTGGGILAGASEKTNKAPKKEITSGAVMEDGFLTFPERGTNESTFSVRDEGDDAGVWCTVKKIGADARTTNYGAPLHIVAETRSEDERQWGRLVTFKNGDGKQIEVNVSLDELEDTTRSLTKRLAKDYGFSWDYAGTQYGMAPLNRFLRSYPKSDQRRVTTKSLGWLNDDFNCFVLGESVVFARGDKCGSDKGKKPSELACIRSEGAPLAIGLPGAGIARRKGTLEEWKNLVGKNALYSKRMMLAICTALTGVVLPIANLSNKDDFLIIYLYGKSGSGKSTILGASASVWNNHEFVHKRHSSNGQEAHLVKSNHMVYIADELGDNSQEVLNNIYFLSNGAGKETMNADRSAREVLHWCCFDLMAGEASLKSLRKNPLNNGEIIRCIEIESVASEARGVFDRFPDDIERDREVKRQELDALPCPADKTSDDWENEKKAQIDLISDNWVKSCFNFHAYGTAGAEFAQAVADDIHKVGLAQYSKSIQAYMNEFVRVATKKAGLKWRQRLERRVLSNFSKIAVAGELAIQYGILPWKEGDAFGAVCDCFDLWLNGSETPASKNRALVDGFLNDLVSNKANYQEYEYNRLIPNETKTVGIEARPPLGLAGAFFRVDGGKIAIYSAGSANSQFKALAERIGAVHLKDALSAFHEAGLFVYQCAPDRKDKEIGKKPVAKKDALLQTMGYAVGSKVVVMVTDPDLADKAREFIGG